MRDIAQNLKTHFKAVKWPTFQQAFRNTVFVMVTSVLTGFLIAAVDTGAGEIVRLFVK